MPGRIKALFVDLPRCTAKVDNTTRRWNQAVENDGICTHTGKYDIDGRVLCTRHAGQKAIEVLLTTQSKQPS